MSRKLQVAINYLLSVMKEEDLDELTINEDGELSSVTYMDGAIKEYDYTSDNPIQEIMNVIEHNADYCVDCMTDANADNAYYLYLMQAYTHFLVANYATEVPISRAIARFLLQHNVLQERTLELGYYVSAYYEVITKHNFNLYQNEYFVLKSKYGRPEPE